MKRLLIGTAVAIPMALASISYAQTTPPATTEAPVTEAPAAAPETMPEATPDTTPYTAPSAAPETTATPLPTADSGTSTATVRGWSVKDKIMGKSVYNENDDKIGDVVDIVLTSGGQAEYFVIGAGGFLGLGQHDVAIPFDKVERNGDRLTLRGYTKDELKALPKVELTE